MPRMNILTTVERETFDSPPVFTSVQRKQYLGFPLHYVASPVASVPQPINSVFC